MSKDVKQWERYLFRRHNLIALSPLNRDLQLLDVLVKKGSHGFLLDRGPIIVRIGSLLSLRSDDDNPDSWEAWANHAKDCLRRLRQNEELENDELFSSGSIGDFESTTEHASNVLLSLSNFGEIGGESAISRFGSALNVTYEKFTEDAAKNLFYGGNQPALWKPDLQRIKLEQTCISDSGQLDLWVVKEIQYAKEIKISACSSSRAHGGLDLSPVMTGMSIPLSSTGTLQMGVKGGKTKDRAIEHVKGQKVPFAFKAIRLVYQEDGSLISKHSNMGIKTLMGLVRPRFGMASTFFDVDKDPIYHMGDLSAKAPININDEEEDFQLLDVVTNGGGPVCKMVMKPSTFFDVDKDPIYHMGDLFAKALRKVNDEEEDIQLLDMATNGGGPTKAQ